VWLPLQNRYSGAIFSLSTFKNHISAPSRVCFFVDTNPMDSRVGLKRNSAQSVRGGKTIKTHRKINDFKREKQIDSTNIAA
jgi:hypothetical protein